MAKLPKTAKACNKEISRFKKKIKILLHNTESTIFILFSMENIVNDIK